MIFIIFVLILDGRHRREICGSFSGVLRAMIIVGLKNSNDITLRYVHGIIFNMDYSCCCGCRYNCNTNKTKK